MKSKHKLTPPMCTCVGYLVAVVVFCGGFSVAQETEHEPAGLPSRQRLELSPTTSIKQEPSELGVSAVQTVQVGLPILFVHGWCSQATTWDSIRNQIAASLQSQYPGLYTSSTGLYTFYDGVTVHFQDASGNEVTPTSAARLFSLAFFPLNPTSPLNFTLFNAGAVDSISIFQKGDELAHALWSIKQLTGAPRVLLVAHSMGGLATRNYLEQLAFPSGAAQFDGYGQDVAMAITVDTPHGGASALDLLTALDNLFLSLQGCSTTDQVAQEMDPQSVKFILPFLNYQKSGFGQPLPDGFAIIVLRSYWIDSGLTVFWPYDMGSDNVLKWEEQDMVRWLPQGTPNLSSITTYDHRFSHSSYTCPNSTEPLHALDCNGTAGTINFLASQLTSFAVYSNSLVISPANPRLAEGSTSQFSVSSVAASDLLWTTLEFPSGGSISPSGVYQAPNTPGQYHVLAFSKSQPTVFGETVVSITTPPALSLSASSLDFGPILFHSASSARRILLGNAGGAALTISSVSATAGDFVATNTCGLTIAPGATCSVNVVFIPTALGLRTGTLTIVDNAPGSPHMVSLSGRGIDFTIVLKRPSRPARSASTSAIITAGRNAVFELAIAGYLAAQEPVRLRCVAPPGTGCRVSESVVDLESTRRVVQVIVNAFAAPRLYRSARLRRPAERATIKVQASAAGIVRTLEIPILLTIGEDLSALK